jgi:predicted transcriptional regulator of viral defense system
MIQTLESLPPTFTTRTALERGVHPREMYRWRDAGAIQELTRGVFRRADQPAPTLPDLLAVSYRVPAGIICCVSALAVHDLTDELPRMVQLAIPRSARPPRIEVPPTEIFRFDVQTFTLGLTTVEAAPGEEVRIYTAERTIVDLVRLRSRLGESIAYGALQRYMRRRQPRPGVILDFARALDVLGPLRAALDVASAG